MMTEMDACIFAGENEIVTLTLIDETCVSENKNGTLIISNSLDSCNTTTTQANGSKISIIESSIYRLTSFDF